MMVLMSPEKRAVLMRGENAWRAEIERLRDAILFAIEAIYGDDVIGASNWLRAALGEEK